MAHFVGYLIHRQHVKLTVLDNSYRLIALTRRSARTENDEKSIQVNGIILYA